MTETEPELGWIDAELELEFPDLRLYYLAIDAQSGRSPREVRDRLRALSNRFRGAQAIALRQDPVPAAYRIFYRQIGLDPDSERTPIEAAAVERLLGGGFASRNLLDDALLIALIETGVPIWALDRDTVEEPLGIRPARVDERLGGDPYGPPLVEGRLVVADAREPLAVLFEPPAPAHRIRTATRRALLFSVQVAGVPRIHVEEALWLCSTVLGADW
jgi:DNA/RNA-binding domain of Phe-tRNA-synthetase-like protein